MKDDNQYKSGIAETIEASGNFVNNVKDPFFLFSIFLIISQVFLIYGMTIFGEKIVSCLLDIRSSIDINNKMISQNNDYLKNFMDMEKFIVKVKEK